MRADLQRLIGKVIAGRNRGVDRRRPGSLAARVSTKEQAMGRRRGVQTWREVGGPGRGGDVVITLPATPRLSVSVALQVPGNGEICVRGVLEITFEPYHSYLSDPYVIDLRHPYPIR